MARSTFRDVFAIAEFRALWTAQLPSVPNFLGGLLLSPIADRLPRRRVIDTDLVSGLLVVVMAVPGVPLAVLIVLLAAVTTTYSGPRSPSPPSSSLRSSASRWAGSRSRSCTCAPRS